MSEAQSALNKIWRCNCWFCRLFARKVLLHYIEKALVYMAEKSAVLGGGVIVAQELDVVKELRDLKTTVSELKSAIAEIKALLSDLTGPYSYYKPREEVEAPARPQPPAPPTSIAEVRAETSRVEVEKPEVKPPTPSGRGLEEIAGVLGEAGRIVREEREVLAGVGLKQAVSLMRIIYEIMKIYPRSSVERMLDLVEQLKIVSREEMSVLRTTINIVEQSLKERITPEENVLLMYLLLKNIGVREEAIEEEVIKSVLNAVSMMRKMSKPTQEAREEKSETMSSGGVAGGSLQGVDNKWENLQQ